MSGDSPILSQVAGYYSATLAEHGASPRGVDWNGEESQVLRFRQLARVIAADGAFTLNDVGCGYGALYDFLEKRKGQWGLVWRRLTYEKDQITPVDPTKAPKLDPKLLARFPVGYRHLAYLQTKVGYKVKVDMPGVDGPDTDKLYALGAGWLKGNKEIGW